MKIFEEYKTKDVPISNKNEYKEFFPKFLTNEKVLQPTPYECNTIYNIDDNVEIHYICMPFTVA